MYREKNISLDEIPLNEWQAIPTGASGTNVGAFESDVYQVFNPLESVKRRNATGGTSPDSVKKQINHAKEFLAKA